jgi:5-formyltetrahydrofolate cyclo-ligase
VSASLRELKAALRARVRDRGRNVPAVERASASAALCARLKQQAIWQRAAAVLFFAPRPDEPDIWPLLVEALALGKQAALLRHSAAENAYAAFVVTDPARDVQAGFYGIREPVEACAPADLNRLDLILVPGVAFGLNGGRLGRGKGYYDRLLSRTPGWKCGVALDWQVEPEIPMGAHDVGMDSLVTPTRWHETPRHPGRAA